MVDEHSQAQENLPSFHRGSSWLDLPVCQNFIAGLCSNTPDECLYAHPTPNMDISNGEVRACYSFFKFGTCNNASCKFYHNKEHQKWLLECQRKKHVLRHGDEREAVSQAPFWVDLTAVLAEEMEESSGDTNSAIEEIPNSSSLIQTPPLADLATTTAVFTEEMEESSGDTNFALEQIPVASGLKRRQSQHEYGEAKRARSSHDPPDKSE